MTYLFLIFAILMKLEYYRGILNRQIKLIYILQKTIYNYSKYFTYIYVMYNV